jgi:hypothetical protein
VYIINATGFIRLPFGDQKALMYGKPITGDPVATWGLSALGTIMDTKTCTKCGEVKDEEEFHRAGKKGRHNSCKECTKSYHDSIRSKINAYLAASAAPSSASPADLVGLGARFGQARELLEKLEWDYHEDITNNLACSICENQHHEGHKPDCKLAAFLNPEETSDD